jgi:hypothetical protein
VRLDLSLSAFRFTSHSGLSIETLQTICRHSCKSRCGSTANLFFSHLQTRHPLAKSRRMPTNISFSGDDVGGAIPDPIPNSEVKPSRADGTARARAWESRSLPGLIPKAPKQKCFGAFLFPSAERQSRCGATGTCLLPDPNSSNGAHLPRA